jgi:hypothetical protein
VPLAFAMGLVGFVGLGLLRGWPPTMANAAQVVYDRVRLHAFSVVPLFILMGNFVARAGLAHELFAPPTPSSATCAGAWRTRHRHRLRRLRRDLRLVHRHRRHDGQGGVSADEEATATATTSAPASSPRAARSAS